MLQQNNGRTHTAPQQQHHRHPSTSVISSSIYPVTVLPRVPSGQRGRQGAERVEGGGGENKGGGRTGGTARTRGGARGEGRGGTGEGEKGERLRANGAGGGARGEGEGNSPV